MKQFVQDLASFAAVTGFVLAVACLCIAMKPVHLPV
jgi:hypothetical protein